MIDGEPPQDCAEFSFKSVAKQPISLPVVISLVLAVVFLIFMVTRFDVDITVTWEVIKNSNPWYLVFAIIAHYSSAISRGIRWRLLLQNSTHNGTKTPGVFYFGQLVFIGWFVNAIGWLRLGDAYRGYIYHNEQNKSFPLTMGTILAERYLDSALIALLLITASPFVLGSGDNVAFIVLTIAISLVGTLTVLLVAISWINEPLTRSLPIWFNTWLERFLQGTMESFRQVPMATFWGLLGWIGEIGRMYLVVKALGFDLRFEVIMFLTVANALLTLVPTPGGVGAVEPGVGGMAVRLSSLSASSATALVVIDRAITYFSVIVLGAALFLVRGAFSSTQSNGSD